MATRKPLVLIDGKIKELPAADRVGVQYFAGNTDPGSTAKEGDEWYNPTDGVCYKRILDGAVLVWAQVQ